MKKLNEDPKQMKPDEIKELRTQLREDDKKRKMEPVLKEHK